MKQKYVEKCKEELKKVHTKLKNYFGNYFSNIQFNEKEEVLYFDITDKNFYEDFREFIFERYTNSQEILILKILENKSRKIKTFKFNNELAALIYLKKFKENEIICLSSRKLFDIKI